MKKTEQIQRVNTSIKVDPDIWKDARIEAIKLDMTVSELLEDAIKDYIKRRGKS